MIGPGHRHGQETLQEKSIEFRAMAVVDGDVGRTDKIDSFLDESADFETALGGEEDRELGLEQLD
jgi:hypothetical protein